MKKEILLLFAFAFLSFQANTQTTLLVDFGTNLSDAPWNNVTSPHSDTIIALIDDSGATTSVTLTVVDSFAWINTAGLAPDGVDFPASATGDSFFGNSSEFSGKTVPTGAVEIAGLTVGESYTFTIFSSRAATDNREAKYQFEGMTTETSFLNAGGNATEVAKATLMPNADGKITLTASPGPNNDNGKGFFYLGAIRITTGETSESGTPLVDFEDGGLVPQKMGIFGQGTVTNDTEIVDNPNASGINTSDKVFAMCKGSGAQEWGGLWLDIDSTESLLNLENGTTLCVDVMMPVNGVVQFKVEKFDTDDGGNKTTIGMDYTEAGQWQKICYDFAETNAAEAGNFRRIAIFPNRGVQPAEEECYLIDNITQSGEGVSVTLLEGEIVGDWESDDTSPTANISGTGVSAMKVDNPSSDEVNNSANVLEYCKDETSTEPFVGMTILVDPIDVTGDTAQIYVSFYAAEETTIRMTLKGATDGSSDVSLDVAYNTPGEWAQLVFDLRAVGVDDKEAVGHIYGAFKLAPDYGNVSNSKTCYYIDDILMNTNGTGVLRELISTTIGFSADHTLFKGYIDLADMSAAINATGITVFAPNDDAINALSSEEKNALDNNIDGALISFILHQTTNDSLPTSLMNEDRAIITRNGRDTEMTADGTIGGANVTQGDVVNSNGILHYMDAVLSTSVEPEIIILDDFESGLYSGWFGFDQGPDSTTNIFLVDNPAPNGVNNSSQVVQHIKFPNAWNSWQGFALRNMERPLNFMGSMTEVCMDVLLPKPSTLRMKFSGSTIEPPAGDDSTLPRYNFESTAVNEWVTVCQDITKPSIQDPMRPLEGDIWNNVAFFFNFVFDVWPEEREFYYFDNYRLKGISVGVENISELENFKMFPNPTTDFLTLSTATPVAYAIIYDTTGKQVLAVVNPLDEQLSVGHLSDGVYFIQMLNEIGVTIGSVRFIKQ